MSTLRDLPSKPSTPRELFTQVGEIISHNSIKLCDTIAKFFIQKKRTEYGAKVTICFRTLTPSCRRYFVQRTIIWIKSDFDLEHLQGFLRAMREIYTT
jgi:hypothetical protein